MAGESNLSLKLNTALTALTLVAMLAAGAFWLMDLGGNREASNNFRTKTTKDIETIHVEVGSVQADLNSYKVRTDVWQKAVEKTLADISTTLAVIQEKLLNDQRQDKAISEIEARLRYLENHHE
jgi:hypothetical protein